ASAPRPVRARLRGSADARTGGGAEVSILATFAGAPARSETRLGTSTRPSYVCPHGAATHRPARGRVPMPLLQARGTSRIRTRPWSPGGSTAVPRENGDAAPDGVGYAGRP